MYCKYCKTDKPEDEFDVLNKEIYGGDGKYRCKHCHSCRMKMIDKKKGIFKQNISICPKCKNEFPEEMGKNGRLYIKCPKCRFKHKKEQNNSVKKLFTKKANTSSASILNDFTPIDKNKIMEMVANKIVEKLLNKL
jgi:DNA-directed RNA polymerase subunit RPC12/RpoP